MEQRSFQRYGRSAEIVYAWYIKAKRNKLYLLLLYLLVFKYIFINLFVITIFEFAEIVGTFFTFLYRDSQKCPHVLYQIMQRPSSSPRKPRVIKTGPTGHGHAGRGF